MFGFGRNDFPIVREHCVAIAKDLIPHIKGEKRAQALEMVALTLERWKLERADTDGTIEIDVAVPLRGLLDMDSWTRAMASQGLLPEKKRRPVAELKPWECADFGVQCDADLFERLLYTDHYTPAEKVEQLLGPGVALALLVDRDGKTMPVDSLLFAVRYLWIIVFTALKGQDSQRRQLESKETKTRAQRLAAGRLGADSKNRSAAMAYAEWRAIAAGLWRGNPLLKDRYVAAKVVEELERRRAERFLKGEKVERIPAVGTVMNQLGGVRNAVLAELARSNRRR